MTLKFTIIDIMCKKLREIELEVIAAYTHTQMIIIL